MRVQLETTSRELLLDAKPLGGGGEANIHPIPEQPHLVAKIYHKPTAEHADKLTAMLAAPPVDPMAGTGHISIAWPTGRLLAPDGEHAVIGYLMPKVEQARLVYEFYNPKSRLQTCPLFHYGYLMRTARNLAAAVRAVHDRGYVIGDVNERNSLVTTQALVTLVDTDSFQVPGVDRVFRCRVGTPEYTPPELQSARFADVDRGPEHDVFGLAVLIFQLLMQGLHPFAGVFTGKGEAGSIPRRIAAGIWPYSKARAVPLQPNPHAPPWEVLPPPIQEVLLRCFDEGHSQPARRPQAATWQRALRDAEQELRHCSANSQHRYYSGLETCPWCVLAKQQRRDPFPAPGQVKGTRTTMAPGSRRTMVPETDVVTKSSAARSSSQQTGPGSKERIQPAREKAGVATSAEPEEDLDILEALPVERGDRLLEMGAVVVRRWQSASWVRWVVAAGSGLMVLAVIALLLWAAFHKPAPGQVNGFSGHQGDVLCLAFAPDGSKVLSGSSDQTLRLWDVETGKELRRFSGHSDWVKAVCFSGDGSRALSGGADRTLRLWDVETGDELKRLQTHSSLILAVVLSPDGAQGMSVTRDGKVHFWNVETGQDAGDQHYPWLGNCVAFATNGRWTLSARGDNVLYYGNLNGNELRRFQGHEQPITCVALSADNRRALSGGADKTVRLWDINTGKELHRFEGHQGEVTSVAFSRNGRYAVSGSSDKTIRLWRLPDPA